MSGDPVLGKILIDYSRFEIDKYYRVKCIRVPVTYDQLEKFLPLANHPDFQSTDDGVVAYLTYFRYLPKWILTPAARNLLETKMRSLRYETLKCQRLLDVDSVNVSPRKTESTCNFFKKPSKNVRRTLIYQALLNSHNNKMRAALTRRRKTRTTTKLIKILSSNQSSFTFSHTEHIAPSCIGCNSRTTSNPNVTKPKQNYQLRQIKYKKIMLEYNLIPAPLLLKCCSRVLTERVSLIPIVGKFFRYRRLGNIWRKFVKIFKKRERLIL